MNDPARSHELVVLQRNYGICKFGAKALVPVWVDGGGFWSVARTPEELSIVCEERLIPAGVHSETGFSCLRVIGPLGFASVGVIASLLDYQAPLTYVNNLNSRSARSQQKGRLSVH
ncbi:MAG: hypothetical protein IH849_00415 [Acidobacteria bacterium]|nr:hypothetical protein [Acidobacteriota bacterium]